MIRFTSIAVLLFLWYACTNRIEKEGVQHSEKNHSDSIVSVSATEQVIEKKEEVVGMLEQKLIDAGLININDIDSTIQIDLRYATSNNFLDTILYDSLSNCYLQKDVAKKLALAQFLLQSEYPQYSLKVYDGVRPRSVQWKMWNLLDMPTNEKTKYVSNPKNGSLHNFGAAVDLTIVDSSGNELDMGTDYDYFGELAYPRLEQKLIKEGKLTQAQLNNRLILRRAMIEAGFTPLTTEWWHFNSCERKEAWEKYQIVE